MSDVALQGHPVTAGTITFAERGAWVADLQVDSEAAPPALVTLTAGDDTWQGAVLYGGVEEGRWSGRVVGGRGRLGHTVPARFYQRLQARPIVEAMVREAGEELDPDAPGLGGYLNAWARARGPLVGLLGLLLGRLGLVWRVTPAGLLTTAPWPAGDIPADAQELGSDPGAQLTMYATEGIDVLPGQGSAGRVVRGVTYTLNGPALRAAVTWR